MNDRDAEENPYAFHGEAEPAQVDSPSIGLSWPGRIAFCVAAGGFAWVAYVCVCLLVGAVGPGFGLRAALPFGIVAAMTFEAFRMFDAARGSVRFTRLWMLSGFAMAGSVILAMIAANAIYPGAGRYVDPLRWNRAALGSAFAIVAFLLASVLAERRLAAMKSTKR